MVPRRCVSAARAREVVMRLRFAPLLCLALSACAGANRAAGARTANASTAEARPAAAAKSSAPLTPESTPPLVGTGPGWLGVELAKRDGGEPGVLIRSVMRGSPAEHAGLAAGDVVLNINGDNVAQPKDLRDHVMAAHAGARVSLGGLRGEGTRLFPVDLEGVPNDDEEMRKNYVGSRAPGFG